MHIFIYDFIGRFLFLKSEKRILFASPKESHIYPSNCGNSDEHHHPQIMNRSEHRRRVPYGENGPEWERDKVNYVLDGLIVYNGHFRGL